MTAVQAPPKAPLVARASARGTRQGSRLRDSRELLVNLTLREIRSKYKRTALGHLWSLVNPLAIMAVYTLVFSVLFRAKPDPGRPSGLNVYAVFLLVGLLPWQFFNNAVNAGMSSLLSNANLLKKVYFRRDVLVMSSVFSWLVTFSIEVGVLLVVLLAIGGMPLPWLPLVVLAMAGVSLFALGLGLLLSVANVYFRDTEHFIAIFFQLWFYLTPVIYPLTFVSAAAHRSHLALFGHKLPILFIYKINPMEHYVQVFRALLYDNRWPSWGDATFCAVATAVTLGVGLTVFNRFEGRLAEEL